jgi:hypothetical protein
MLRENVAAAKERKTFPQTQFHSSPSIACDFYSFMKIQIKAFSCESRKKSIDKK